MVKPSNTLWKIEPHTQAKHEILRRYLGAWFPILGKYNKRLVYLDGFCGPGRYKGGEDGSPIIALRQALDHQERLKRNKITFLFIDERDDRIQHLITELAAVGIPNTWGVHTRVDQFDTTLEGILDDLSAKGLGLTPTFAFVDPFGFKGVPFVLVRRLLSNPKTEVFINIMVDSINRFIEHPDPITRSHIVDLFGTNRAITAISSEGARVSALRLLYQEQLQKHARFVHYFEMTDSRGKVIYYLFFATNHPLGHAKMKEAFWKVDPSSGFKFSDKTNPNQMVLFDLDPSADLAMELRNRFTGQTRHSETVIQFVEDETPYTAKHARSALKKLEQDGAIDVKPYKRDATKRRWGTFPKGTVIEFLNV